MTALPTRTVEPTQIARGERIQWQKTYADYSAAAYNLQYRFRGDGPGINVDATANGETFVSEITATASATLAAGRYRWQAWLTEKAVPTNTFVQQSGYLTIEAGFTESATGDVDLRSPAKKIIDAIDAAMLASAGDVIEYEVSTPAGTNRVKRSRNEAMAMRKEYAGIYAREQAIERVRNGGKYSQTVYARLKD